jgi:hypothetical protein
MCWITFRVDLSTKYLFFCLLLALLVRMTYISVSPIGSDDVYRYMWDGKVQTHGLNPYSYTPNSDTLNYLHSPLLPASINHPDLKTLYFPFSEWIFYVCYQISGEAIWGYKLFLLISEIATIIGLFLLLKQLKLPLKFLLFYALCPLPIFQFAIDSHLDGLGLPLFIFGISAYINRKITLSLFLLSLSISIKPIGLVLLPIFLLHQKTWKNRLQVIITPALIIALQFTPYLLNSNPFDTLFTYVKHWTFNGIVFETINLYFIDNQKSRLICVLLLSILLLAVYFSKKQLFNKIYLAFLFMLLLSPVVHPWYVAWLTVLLPITCRWSGILLTGLVSLTSFTILNYKLYGIWEQSPVILIIEYIPVILFLLYELYNSNIEQNTRYDLIDKIQNTRN